MALTCPSDLSAADLGFTEFIDCSTLSINYDMLGTATVSFTVVAAHKEPAAASVYTDLTFGHINFVGHITSLEIRRIPGTVVYEHRYTLSATGCGV